MSSALAIASVTFLLKDLLDNRLIGQGVTASVGEVSVTALPPDRVSVGAEERSQLNLFLYRITPHSAWRSLDVAEGNGHDGARRQPPLALDLHYLLTAYGEHDFQAEILLGYAMQLLHETPVLTREAIRGALASGGSGTAASPARAALAASGLAEATAQIKIYPEFLSTEETSKLWSALQARYRPSAAYKASAVLLEAEG